MKTGIIWILVVALAISVGFNIHQRATIRNTDTQNIDTRVDIWIQDLERLDGKLAQVVENQKSDLATIAALQSEIAELKNNGSPVSNPKNSGPTFVMKASDSSPHFMQVIITETLVTSFFMCDKDGKDIGASATNVTRRAKEIAIELLKIDGITGVRFNPYMITIIRADQFRWEDMEKRISNILEEKLSTKAFYPKPSSRISPNEIPTDSPVANFLTTGILDAPKK